MKSPAYEWSVFLKACRRGQNVSVECRAKKGAREDFNLNSEAEIIRFIANDGLINPILENSKPWEKNPDPQNKIMVDSYSFCFGKLHGYIAFRFNELTNKWVIKSFKKNILPDTRNMRFIGLDKLLSEELI